MIARVDGPAQALRIAEGATFILLLPRRLDGDLDSDPDG